MDRGEQAKLCSSRLQQAHVSPLQLCDLLICTVRQVHDQSLAVGGRFAQGNVTAEHAVLAFATSLPHSGIDLSMPAEPQT